MKRIVKDSKIRIRIISLLIIVFSIICALITKEYFIGTTILLSGLMNCYLASEGHMGSYFFGIIYSLLSSYLFYMNGQYGLSFVSLFVFIPIGIQGIHSWNKNKDASDIIYTRRLNFKTSIYIIIFSLFVSYLIGSQLSLIKSSNLSFLDASSVVLCIVQLILSNLRYIENWYLYIIVDLIDLTIWSINYVNGGLSSIMMLITQVGYLLFSIYGMYNWIVISKRNEKGIKKIVRKIKSIILVR